MTHLVIRAPNWVGDLVMATPVLEAAARALAAGALEGLTILCRGHLLGVLEGAPYHGHVVPLERDEAGGWAAARAAGGDTALLLSSSFGAALRARRAGFPRRVGVALHRRGWLLTERLVPATRGGRRVPTPTALMHRDLAHLVGLEVPSVHPVLHVTEAEVERARDWRAAVGLEPEEPYFVCSPGAAFGAAKLWPPPRFAEALEALHARHGVRTVITGGPAEEALMDAVAAAAPHARSLAAVPRDLGGLKALIAGARLLVVGDSGPRWYAAAFDTPCVSVMGPNFPELTATSYEWCRIVRTEGLPCAPCLERVCPLEHHACMLDIPSAAVVAAAEELLARAAAPGLEAPVEWAG